MGGKRGTGRGQEVPGGGKEAPGRAKRHREGFVANEGGPGSEHGGPGPTGARPVPPGTHRCPPVPTELCVTPPQPLRCRKRKLAGVRAEVTPAPRVKRARWRPQRCRSRRS